jgi:hypothetical protein
MVPKHAECGMIIHISCHTLIDLRPCKKVFDEAKIRMAFLKIFTHILKSYGDYLIFPPEEVEFADPVENQPTINLSRRRSSFVSWKSLSRKPSIKTRRESISPVKEKDLGGKETALFAEVTEIPDVWFNNAGFLESLDRDTRVYIFLAFLKLKP